MFPNKRLSFTQYLSISDVILIPDFIFCSHCWLSRISRATKLWRILRDLHYCSLQRTKSMFSIKRFCSIQYLGIFDATVVTTFISRGDCWHLWSRLAYTWWKMLLNLQHRSLQEAKSMFLNGRFCCTEYLSILDAILVTTLLISSGDYF